jgi:hypothetical protein
VEELVQAGVLRTDLNFEGHKGEWLALSDLVVSVDG